MTQCATEDEEQARMVEWLTGRGWLFSATANGAGMGPAQWRKMARTGVRRGVPDIVVFEELGGFRGMAIEMKRAKGGTVSPEQGRWHAWLRERGWLVIVARGWADGVRQIQEAVG